MKHACIKIYFKICFHPIFSKLNNKWTFLFTLENMFYKNLAQISLLKCQKISLCAILAVHVLFEDFP